MAAIKIVNIPAGEAPLDIRQAWVGCILPLPNGWNRGLLKWRIEGVLSGPKRSWLARLLFPAKRMIGYPVRVSDAMTVLEKHNPIAAQWWREETPHTMKNNRLFIFDAEACEPLPFK